MVQHFSMATCQKEYVEIQEAEGIQLLYDFIHKPHGLMGHPMRYATSALTSISKPPLLTPYQQALTGPSSAYGVRGEEYGEIETVHSDYLNFRSSQTEKQTTKRSLNVCLRSRSSIP